jgi:hypothetical protein
MLHVVVFDVRKEYGRLYYVCPLNRAFKIIAGVKT